MMVVLNTEDIDVHGVDYVGYAVIVDATVDVVDHGRLMMVMTVVVNVDTDIIGGCC